MSDVAVQFPIEMSDAAAAKVKTLITEEENPELKLRVYITGGGCSLPVAVVQAFNTVLRLMRKSMMVILSLKRTASSWWLMA